jgi:hypothetical protein
MWAACPIEPEDLRSAPDPGLARLLALWTAVLRRPGDWHAMSVTLRPFHQLLAVTTRHVRQSSGRSSTKIRYAIDCGMGLTVFVTGSLGKETEWVGRCVPRCCAAI